MVEYGLEIGALGAEADVLNGAVDDNHSTRVPSADHVYDWLRVARHEPLDGRGRQLVLEIERAVGEDLGGVGVAFEELGAQLHADHVVALEERVVEVVDERAHGALGSPQFAQEVAAHVEADLENAGRFVLARRVAARLHDVARMIDGALVDEAVLVQLVVVDGVGANGEELGLDAVVEDALLVRGHLGLDEARRVLLDVPRVARPREVVDLGSLVVEVELGVEAGEVAERVLERLVYEGAHLLPVHDERTVREHGEHKRGDHRVEPVGVAVVVEAVYGQLERQLARHDLLMYFAVLVQVARLAWFFGGGGVGGHF